MRHRKAFTLIELLVVIAIIAILAAILFPVFAQAKAAAKKAVCMSQLDEIGIAWQMYANDYDDVNLANGDSTLVGGWSSGTLTTYYWFGAVKYSLSSSSSVAVPNKGLLYPYVKDQQMLSASCPSNNLPYFGVIPVDYGLNVEVQDCADFVTLGSDIVSENLTHEGCPNGLVEEPASTILMSDAAAILSTAGGTVLKGQTISFGIDDERHAYGVHSGFGNIAWMDGHVKSMRTQPPNFNNGVFASPNGAAMTASAQQYSIGDYLHAPCPAEPATFNAVWPEGANCAYYYLLDKTGTGY